MTWGPMQMHRPKAALVAVTCYGMNDHFESRPTIYSYFDFGLKNSSFWLRYQRPSSSPYCFSEILPPNG